MVVSFVLTATCVWTDLAQPCSPLHVPSILRFSGLPPVITLPSAFHRSRSKLCAANLLHIITTEAKHTPWHNDVSRSSSVPVPPPPSMDRTQANYHEADDVPMPSSIPTSSVVDTRMIESRL
jgi:hypothetical protein